MLIMTFKDLSDAETLDSPSRVFDGIYYKEWFDEELVKKMVKDIDKTDVLAKDKLVSEVLGDISVTKLSSGVKGLILMLYEEELRASRYF